MWMVSGGGKTPARHGRAGAGVPDTVTAVEDTLSISECRGDHAEWGELHRRGQEIRCPTETVCLLCRRVASCSPVKRCHGTRFPRSVHLPRAHQAHAHATIAINDRSWRSTLPWAVFASMRGPSHYPSTRRADPASRLLWRRADGRTHALTTSGLVPLARSKNRGHTDDSLTA